MGKKKKTNKKYRREKALYRCFVITTIFLVMGIIYTRAMLGKINLEIQELSDIIIRNIVNSELKLFSPCENIIPYKSFKYDILPKSQNTSLNNSYISSSCASLDQISFGNNNSYSNLNESLLSQMSYYSEFNKTIRDKNKEEKELTPEKKDKQVLYHY